MGQDTLTPETPAARPLMPLPALMWRMGVDSDAAMRLVEEGAIVWAFDVGLSPRRKMIHVLTECVNDLLENRCRFKGMDSEWEAVSALILPPSPVVTTLDISACLCCGSRHIANLVSRKQFELVPGHKPHHGPGGSAKVFVASVRDWLRKRRFF